MLISSKTIFKILIVFFSFSQATAKDQTEATTKMLSESRLSCISDALTKMGKPIDTNYLALLGLIAREKSVLIGTIDNTDPKKSGQLRAHFDSVEIKSNSGGDIQYTGAMNYQMNVIKMLTSAGYCSPGKVSTKETNYEKYIHRMGKDRQISKYDDSSDRNDALSEIGVSGLMTNWNDVMKNYFIDKFLPENKDKNVKDFFSMTHKERQEFYKGKRTGALANTNSALGIKDCLQDIESQKAADVDADAYKVCDAIYFECGIATTVPEGSGRGELFRLNNKGQSVRVGGDWCNKEIAPKPKDYVSKNTPDKNVGTSPNTPRRTTVNPQIPPAAK